ncbi:phosphopentomutase [Aliidiomarina maris]|uniref:Phosphopentomutase n=1 Tax=Aliidiomarina maris TaxID=531312 RepID=A0A327WZ92_9GAMM|nr:phosphopentomutase [Aliidiomarina maris]MBA3988409.1 phosphopentomutase [Idiomarina sp.]RAJ99070.1 phosphopentomutase [Aliidiomarina maris]RUO27767.1 phosphopentomutase [Aliidiomarina maris]
MARSIILMMDSFGVGASEDAATFGDTGANTLGSIARHAELTLPNLERLGLGALATEASGERPRGLNYTGPYQGLYGYAAEISRGKDTPSGHWELAGVPVLFDWHYFPDTKPCFPADFIDALITRNQLPGVLGECHASGTTIIAELGEQHCSSGKPIVYTSADSVLQIAAHEETFGLTKLLALCEDARQLLDELGMNVGRVIARPFTGSDSASFTRTGNRRDYSVLPPAPTVLDILKQAGGEVISIGKIADIYAHQGITQTVKATGNDALFSATLEAIRSAPDNSLIFPNFVDFDSHYGHRRDIQGYAAALNAFDQRLPELEALLKPGDVVFITADHGCDPSFPGSDHTREFVPVLCFGPGIESKNIGRRATFADIGQSIAKHHQLGSLAYGTSFI